MGGVGGITTLSHREPYGHITPCTVPLNKSVSEFISLFITVALACVLKMLWIQSQMMTQLEKAVVLSASLTVCEARRHSSHPPALPRLQAKPCSHWPLHIASFFRVKRMLFIYLPLPHRKVKNKDNTPHNLSTRVFMVGVCWKSLIKTCRLEAPMSLCDQECIGRCACGHNHVQDFGEGCD